MKFTILQHPFTHLILPFFILLISYYPMAAQDDDMLIEKKRSRVDVSDMEVSLRLNDFFIYYASSVEETADNIYFRTANPEIKKAALMWKLYGISAMQKAISFNDPIVCFYNAWPLSKQMIIFFEDGPGRWKLGPYYKRALNLNIQLESMLDSIFIDVGGEEDFAKHEQQINQWVTENPIKDFYFNRTSTVRLFAQWLGEEKRGLAKSVVDITEEVSNLSNKINVYADILPKQARWQVDYALMTYMTDTTLAVNPDKLMSQLDRITRTVELTPEIIAASLNTIDEQRIETLQHFVAEREAVFDEIEYLIDKVFWRITIIAAILGISIIIAVIIYKKM